MKTMTPEMLRLRGNLSMMAADVLQKMQSSADIVELTFLLGMTSGLGVASQLAKGSTLEEAQTALEKAITDGLAAAAEKKAEK